MHGEVLLALAGVAFSLQSSFPISPSIAEPSSVFAKTGVAKRHEVVNFLAMKETNPDRTPMTAAWLFHGVIETESLWFRLFRPDALADFLKPTRRLSV